MISCMLIIFAVLLGIDVLLKQRIEEEMNSKEERGFFGGKLIIRKVYNRGFIMNLLDNYPIVVKNVTIVTSIGILVWDILLFMKKGRMIEKIGMTLLSAGVASLEQVERLCTAGLDFVRVGTNVDSIEKSEPYIRLCKKMGVMVMANYMKSYVMEPKQFAQQVKKSESYGVDAVYLVDSAGSMLPTDILRYYEEIREVSALPLGYHGHNNLGLALSNSLYAARVGFSLIDASLQGLGRSAGNTVTELLVAVSQKASGRMDMDINELLLLGKKYVARFVGSGITDPIDTVCGLAGFHSSYLQAVHRCAGKFGVSPLELIAAYAKMDRLNMDENLLEMIAKQLPQKKEVLSEIDMHGYLVNEQGQR